MYNGYRMDLGLGCLGLDLSLYIVIFSNLVNVFALVFWFVYKVYGSVWYVLSSIGIVVYFCRFVEVR